VTLAIDIMAINKIPFMVITLRNMHFGTVQHICDNTKRTLITSIQQTVWTYHARGFQICNILSDGGFRCFRNNLADMGITLNVESSNNMYLKSRNTYELSMKG